MRSVHFHLIFGLCLLPALVFAQTNATGEDLGTKSRTYKLDADARDLLKAKAQQLIENGQAEKAAQAFRKRQIDAIRNPEPLGIPVSKAFKVERFNPKFKLQQDYKNEKGEVVAKKGMEIEPLKQLPLSFTYFFIDGRAQDQIDYAIKVGQTRPTKIILVAGSAVNLRWKYKDTLWRGTKGIPFYWDQRAMIINSLRNLYNIDLRSVPAQISQVNEQLQILYGMQP
jgi:conjugal transfer pilus assembly protein TraW